MSAEQNKKPPINAKRIYRWADLPDCSGAALYLVTNPSQALTEQRSTPKDQDAKAAVLEHYLKCRAKHPLRPINEVVEAW